jgi:hypothetical protein
MPLRSKLETDEPNPKTGVIFMPPDLESNNDAALGQLRSVEEMRVARGQCGKCGDVMDFTRPVAVIVCEKCPKCEGEAFSPA